MYLSGWFEKNYLKNNVSCKQTFYIKDGTKYPNIKQSILRYSDMLMQQSAQMAENIIQNNVFFSLFLTKKLLTKSSRTF